MSWFKKLIGASVLSSLFFIAPERAIAEACVSCALFNTGGYNLYSLGQNMNSLSSCLPAVTYQPQTMVVPVYLSNPSLFLSSFQSPTYWGGSCGTFTQSCGGFYDTIGLNGYGTSQTTPLINSQLLQLIQNQNILLSQLNNPYSTNPYYGGGSSYVTPTYPNYPIYPSYPSYPSYPNYPIVPTPPLVTTTPSYPYDNTVPYPTTPGLPYGGCDNITVPCPQPGVNTYTNPSVGGGTSTNPFIPSGPSYAPNLGYDSVPPNHYQVPRGVRRFR